MNCEEPVERRFRPLALLLCLGLFTPFSDAPAADLSCDLDSVLKNPELWNLSPDELQGLYWEPGFTVNPYFRLIESDDRQVARFTRSLSGNNRNRMTILDGLNVVGADLEFAREKTRKMTVYFYVGQSTTAARAIYEKCAPEVAKRFGAKPTPWRYRHDPEAIRDAFKRSRERRSSPFGFPSTVPSVTTIVTSPFGTVPRTRQVEPVTQSEGLLWQTPGEIALLDLNDERPGPKSVRLRIVQTGNEPYLQTEEYAQMYRSHLTWCPLDPLFHFPEVWRLSADAFEQSFASPSNPGVSKEPPFRWLAKDKSRAIFYRRPYSNHHIDLRIFGGETPVEEVVVDFAEGKISAVTVSIYNSGDSGRISAEEFNALYRSTGKHLGEWFGVSPAPNPPGTRTGIPVSGFRWQSPQKGFALLEYNPEAIAKENPNPHYLRLKLRPRPLDLMGVRRFQLPKNVKREANGDVWIPSIPMVDQGDKGYCVVAACQRIFEYYQIPLDQHQIAPLVNVTATRGTTADEMDAALQEIDEKFHTRFGELLKKNSYVSRYSQPSPRPAPDSFKEIIHTNIDNGVPLLWALLLGGFTEPGGVSVQQGGGHMRLIIGYNKTDDTLIFSDTWGLGHERKTVRMDDAYGSTTRLFRFEPKMK